MMFRVFHSQSMSGLSFVVSTHKSRELAERRARGLADQVVRLYGNRARRYERSTERIEDQVTTGYGVVIDEDTSVYEGARTTHVRFDVVGPDDCPSGLSYSRHIEGN